MKNLLYTIISIITLNACSGTGDKSSGGEIDTIKTESGVQYYYKKKGDGQKIDTLSEVKAYLSLMVNDSVVWNTDEGPDSLFTYIAGYSGLIQGFTEISYFLREGDEVVVIIPSELAYGQQGAGELIPPNSTVVYDKFEVREVSAPKGILTDTLLLSIREGGISSMIDKYEGIINTSDSSKFHTDINQIYGVWQNLMQNRMLDKALEVANYFSETKDDLQLQYYKIVTHEEMGDIQTAVDNLEKLVESDTTNNPFLVSKLEELKGKL